MCLPSVLKYVINDFPFSPIPPHQDQCLAVFSCCDSYIVEGIIVCGKRVADCDKQIFKTEICKHEIRNRTKWKWKWNLQTAETCWILRKVYKEGEIFYKWKWQIIFVFLILFFLLIWNVSLLQPSSLLTPVFCLPDVKKIFLIIAYEANVLRR